MKASAISSGLNWPLPPQVPQPPMPMAIPGASNLSVQEPWAPQQQHLSHAQPPPPSRQGQPIVPAPQPPLAYNSVHQPQQQQQQQAPHWIGGGQSIAPATHGPTSPPIAWYGAQNGQAASEHPPPRPLPPMQPPQPPNGYSHQQQQAGVSTAPPAVSQPLYHQQQQQSQRQSHMPLGPPVMQPPQPPQPQPQPQPQSQSRSLDPDQMPSAVQVMEDDRRRYPGGLYESQPQSALPPPLVTTDFVSVDRGSCCPRYIRATLYSVPCTADLLKSTHVPLGLVVSPMAARPAGEAPLPVSDLGASGPVRCVRCRAYMSPYAVWLEGGRRFQCAMCGGVTDTPEAYFAHLDNTGRRMDTWQRPELHLGSYELLVTAEYCKTGRAPNGPPPGIVFAIDVGYRAVRSGLTSLVCGHIKRKIQSLLPAEEAQEPGQSPLRVGFITYDRSVHYYNLSPGLSRPQMLMVGDLEEAFAPLCGPGFLVSPAESAAQIQQLLDCLPGQFADTASEADAILGPLVEGALDALRSAGCPGKLVLFHTGLPTAEAPGRLRNRDDRKLLGTDKEKAILCPAGEYYTRLGERCAEAGVGVDLFVCCDAYVDLASIGQLAFVTGGSLYKYAAFQAGTHDRQLTRDLEYSLANCRAFDCVMRVRTSAGLRTSEFYGGMHMANNTDVETGVFASDRAVTLELKHEDKLADGQPVLVQCAFLYTGLSGQRRVRVHNLALGMASQATDVFRSADLDSVANLLAKSALKQLLRRGPKETRDQLVTRCINVLAAYRRLCAANSVPGQLILPEVMKLLPLYANGIIKNDAFQGSDISTDDRSYLMYLCSTMDAPASNAFFYPRLMPVHDLPLDGTDEQQSPRCIRCSVERLSQKGVYLLENGIVMFMWIGHSVGSAWLCEVFGVGSLAEVNTEKPELPDIDTPLSKRIRGLVGDIRRRRRRHLRLYVIPARDKLEPWFLNFLIEDRSMASGGGGGSGGSSGVGGGASYVDFLLYVHKEIRSLLG